MARFTHFSGNTTLMLPWILAARWLVQGVPTTNQIILLNLDNTLTVIDGIGLGLDGTNTPTGGTITKVTRLSSDGLTPIEQLTSIAPGYQLSTFYSNILVNVGGVMSGNDVVVGTGAVPEMLFGYSGNDAIYAGGVPGSSASVFGINFDVLVGGAGNDTFYGGASNRANYIVAYALEFDGTQGVSVNLGTGTAIDSYGNTDRLNNVGHIVATMLNDSLTGGALDDIFAPGGGFDSIDGGGGFNTLSYIYSSALLTDAFGFTTGITVNYTSATAGTVLDPFGTTDTFTNIQRVGGTRFADTYNGNAGTREVFAGMGGSDIYNGNAGDGDMVDASVEVVSGATKGISVNLSPTTAQSGIAASTLVDSLGGVDILVNIGGAIGTRYGDNFYGNAGANVFIGNDGNDYFRGNAGADLFDGGNGRDIAEYRFETGTTPTSGITVNLATLATGTVTDTTGNVDALISIEQIHGSNRNDVFNGSTGEDRFAPGRGDDVINSGGGRDVIIYGIDAAATSGISFNGALPSQQMSSTYYGIDTFLGFTAGINLVATHLIDNLVGTSLNDVLQPSNGADAVNGGAGADILAYTDSSTNIGVSFFGSTAGAGYVIDAGGAIDTYSSIEVLRGSRFNDVFNGGAANETFQGILGSDTMHGGGGVNTIDYSADGLMAAFFGGVPRGVVVDLALGTATDGTGSTDSFDDIQNVIGTGYSDTIVGSSLANIIYGGGSNDTMTGGAGGDSFVFNAPLASTNLDTITDFVSGVDRMRIDDGIFVGTNNIGATLDAGDFVANAGGVATATSLIIYDTTTGAVYYDADGSGLVSARIQFAQLTTKPALAASDFVVF